MEKILNQVFPPEIRNPYSIGFMSLLALFLIFKVYTLSNSNPETLMEPSSLDTFIPKGLNLININIVNSESLDSIIGEKGIVDVYIPNRKGIAPKILIRKARILRAPLNPSHFAILVPEQWTKKILMHGNEFIVSVASPDSSGTEIVSDTPVSRPGVRFDFN